MDLEQALKIACDPEQYPMSELREAFSAMLTQLVKYEQHIDWAYAVGKIPNDLWEEHQRAHREARNGCGEPTAS